MFCVLHLKSSQPYNPSKKWEKLKNRGRVHSPLVSHDNHHRHIAFIFGDRHKNDCMVVLRKRTRPHSAVSAARRNAAASLRHRRSARCREALVDCCRRLQGGAKALDEAARPLVCLFKDSAACRAAPWHCLLLRLESRWRNNPETRPPPANSWQGSHDFGCLWMSVDFFACLWMSLDVFCMCVSLVSFLVVCWSGCSIPPRYDLVGRETQRTVAEITYVHVLEVGDQLDFLLLKVFDIAQSLNYSALTAFKI